MDTTANSSSDLEAARKELEKRERSQRWMNYSLWAGILSLFIAIGIWMTVPEDIVVFAGTGLYWLGFLGMLGIYFGTSISLEDERDAQIAAEAGGVTLGAIAVLFVFFTPAAVALDATGTYQMPAEVWGVSGAFFLVFAIYSVSHWYYSRQHS